MVSSCWGATSAPQLFVVDVFECRGSPYDVGRQLAVAYHRSRPEGAGAPQGDLLITAFDIDDARRELLACAPNLVEELHGIAEGLKMPFEEAGARFSNARLSFPRRWCSAQSARVSTGAIMISGRRVMTAL